MTSISKKTSKTTPEKKITTVATHLSCQVESCDCEGWNRHRLNNSSVDSQTSSVYQIRNLVCSCRHSLYSHFKFDNFASDLLDKQYRFAKMINHLLKKKENAPDQYVSELLHKTKKKFHTLVDQPTDVDSSSLSSLSFSSSPSEKEIKQENSETLIKTENSDAHQETLQQVSLTPIEEEKQKMIRVKVVRNDDKDESLILLSNLKVVFQRQLPEMPKEYVSRLIYDRSHISIAIVKEKYKIVGGITYKLFEHRTFAEIVFCAISSDEQVKGYGSFLMNHFKNHISRNTKARHFLTYADNYAIGYFKKQGFKREITLEKSYWVGYIKDYEGGTLMQCTVNPKIDYLNYKETLKIQLTHLTKKIKAYCKNEKIYPGLEWKETEAYIPATEIPGLNTCIHKLDLSKASTVNKLMNNMLKIVDDLIDDPNSWPFLEPVNCELVKDYREYISLPMDLSTLRTNTLEHKYATIKNFCEDAQLVFDNCRIFNASDTPYYKAADKLEKTYKKLLKKHKLQ